MKDYLKRLKEHPGIGYAFAFTIMGALSGASNKSAPPLVGAIFGGFGMGIVVWGYGFNFKYKEKKIDQRRKDAGRRQP